MSNKLNGRGKAGKRSDIPDSWADVFGLYFLFLVPCFGLFGGRTSLYGARGATDVLISKWAGEGGRLFGWHATTRPRTLLVRAGGCGAAMQSIDDVRASVVRCHRLHGLKLRLGRASWIFYTWHDIRRYAGRDRRFPGVKPNWRFIKSNVTWV